MLSTGAFNALLKTLEEPPEHVIFILATTEPHKILPTILSRCQRYDFTKLSDKDIKNRLKDVLEKEGVNYNDEAIDIIISLADGGTCCYRKLRDVSGVELLQSKRFQTGAAGAAATAESRTSTSTS